MAGVILLTAMAVGGFSLWIKRRKDRRELKKQEESTTTANSAAENDRDMQNL